MNEATELDSVILSNLEKQLAIYLWGDAKNGRSVDPEQSQLPLPHSSHSVHRPTPNNKEQNRARVLEAQGDSTFLFTCLLNLVEPR